MPAGEGGIRQSRGNQAGQDGRSAARTRSGGCLDAPTGGRDQRLTASGDPHRRRLQHPQAQPRHEIGASAVGAPSEHR